MFRNQNTNQTLQPNEKKQKQLNTAPENMHIPRPESKNKPAKREKK